MLGLQAKTDQDNAENWNLGIEIALASIYVLANMIIFIPPWIQQRSHVRQLEQDDPIGPAKPNQTFFETAAATGTSDVHPADARSSIKRHTVHEDAEYFTWKRLKNPVAA